MPRTGQHHSEEGKGKIRAALVAIHPTRGMEKVDGVWIPRRKRNPRGFVSAERRKKMSDAMKGRAGTLSPAYGKHHSEEACRRKSIAMTGEKHPMFGKHHTEEAREKISAAVAGRMGAKAPNWKGGITPLVRQIRFCAENRKWRADVFTRDNFMCVLCGIGGCFIEADHYPKSFISIFRGNEIKLLEQAIACEEFWDISNGRTLCRKCHDNTKKKVKV